MGYPVLSSGSNQSQDLKSEEFFSAVVLGRHDHRRTVRESHCHWLWKWRREVMKQGMQLFLGVGKGKETGSPLKSQKRTELCPHLPSGPCPTSNLQNWKAIYLCCFKLLSFLEICYSSNSKLIQMGYFVKSN